MKKIISYNVNGIRAALNKGFGDWIKATGADVVCLQEIKANPEQFDASFFEKLGYHHYWYPAQKKGYSGVAILSKEKPTHVEFGCGIKAYDEEGRIIRADFDQYSVMSVYMPSGTSGEERQDFKFKFLDDFFAYSHMLLSKHKNIIISGDYNICHKPIDIHNPVSNANTSGFLPEERKWIGNFIDSGFIDTFRMFNTEPHNYTWWSYRANARAKNLGWRIDYNMASNALKDKLSGASILPEAHHSDHCPVMLRLNL